MSGPTPEKALIGVPDRWMHCPKTGKLVDGLFFPFKTPLCSLYDDQIEKNLRFHPEDVFNHPAVKGKKIGLWIDLTKTDRYYFVKEVESHGCIYRKMPLAGHGSSPTQDETDRFVRLVQGFTRDHPGEVVGVHCTHGFNRTGFLIAAYMVVVKDWAVDCAVLTFAKERPCGIYKQDYLGDLFERYGDPDDCLEAPNKPSWEYGDAVGYCDDNEASTSVAHPQENTENLENGKEKPRGKQFMDGLVRGVVLVTDPLKKKMLQGKIKELVGAKRDGFPGLQPVSLERSRDNDNLKMLAQRPYMVSWKADGMRYMVYICDENEVYAFDRDNEVFLIQGLSFPHRKHPRHIVNTLVDSEMIIDHVKDEHGNTLDLPRLLIYDIIHFEDMHVGKENFDIRFMCIRRELIEPRNAAIKAGRIRKEREPMSVRVKDFWEMEALPKLFEPKFTKNVGHEIDGLILQPVDAPYTPGRSDIVLKWKPPSHNSIDFKLQIRKVVKEGELPQHIGYLYVQHANEPMATMKATKKLLPYDNKIIECTFENGQWVFMRERTDKSLPNSLKTAQAVFNSMINPIDKDMLIDFVAKYGYKRKHSQIEPERKRPRNEYS
uniref:mRNA-capping enzyme n=1 Tax=Haemonchus contortus TaxID=6289 RepID=A0A7I4YXB1_HAECO